MIRKKTLLLMTIGCLITILGCVSAGLKRTSFDQWSIRRFDKIGIDVDLPDATMLVSSSNVKWRTLSFRFHSLNSGVLLAEPLYLVTFYFERLSKRQYTEFVAGDHSLSYYWVWKDHHASEYTNIVRFAWTDMGLKGYGYRRDYRCSNGDFIVAGVEQFCVKQDQDSFARDTDAIERVLKSVKEVAGVSCGIGVAE